MGFDESSFALPPGRLPLIDYLKTHDLGKIVGADAMMRLFPGLVRIPDAAFISWGRYPKKKRRRGEIPTVAPDLVVEVLSKGNTPQGDEAQARANTSGPASGWSGTSTRASGPSGSTRRWIARPCSARTRRSTAATSCRDSRCRSATGSPRPSAPGRAGRSDEVVADLGPSGLLSGMSSAKMTLMNILPRRDAAPPDDRAGRAGVPPGHDPRAPSLDRTSRADHRTTGRRCAMTQNPTRSAGCTGRPSPCS